MQVIDFLIEGVALASAAYLGVMFVAGLARRPRHAAAVVEQPTEQELFDALSDFGADVAAGLMTEQEAVEAVYGPIVTDCIVPFRRPVRQQPTDRELIELAKSTDYPGAKKWSYSRKLNQQQRESLLLVWQTQAA